jgi:large subunit ribosomal protein L17
MQDKKLVAKVTDDLAQRFATRPGGYTRVVKAGFRSHDKAPLAYIEYVDNSLPPLKLTKEEFGTLTQSDVRQ